MSIIFILLVTLFLAYANGANDNFKGVATLFGSGTTDYKKALWWASLTTFLGSLSAIFIATKFISAFSGKRLVPVEVANTPDFLISVALGAAITVFIATLSGIPISTTHSLTGALVGAGLASAGTKINFATMANNFFMSLLVSPALSALLTLIVLPCLRFVWIKSGVKRQMCLCIGQKVEPLCLQPDGAILLKSTGIALTVDQLQNCQQYYQGKILF